MTSTLPTDVYLASSVHSHPSKLVSFGGSSVIRRLLGRMVPSGSIFERTVQSGMWMGSIKVSSRILQLLMLVVLARLLSPRDFGLVGIALICVSATNKLTKIGLNAALIQQAKENVDDYLDTCWCLEGVRGLLIFFGLFALAPHIAGFFGEPTATPIIQVIAVGPLLIGFRNPAVVYFQKNLEFHKEFVYFVSGSLVQFVVGIGYALVSPTVWALVFAYVAGDLTRFVMSYLINGYRPRPFIDVGAASELIHYGKWITASSIINFIYHKGDDTFVGWYLSATALGFYQYAYNLADAPSTEVAEIVSKVTFPTYSKLQAQPDALRDALLRTTRVTAVVTVPMALGIALVAPSFVPVVLGAEWTPMILVLQLLAVYGLVHALTRNFASLWKAIGRPDYLAKLGTLRVITLGLLIWPATATWGIEGAALAALCAYLIPGFPLQVYITARETDMSSVAIYREYFYPLVAGMTMYASLRYAMELLQFPAWLELTVLVPAGALIYTTAVLVLDRQFNWGIEENVHAIVGGLKS